MRIETLWIVFIALCWGGYPLLSRSAAYDGPRGVLILMIAGLVPIVVAATLARSGAWPEPIPLFKLAMAGVMMGSGLLAFYALTTSAMDASVSIPIVDVAMLMVSAVGAILIFSEPLTVQKGLGIALMLGGIVLIRPS